ncbi:hypothetical protein CGI64_00205 [Vibrio parahaemolyticus]|nr:hypothetical protein CGI64_00205 [Vibrio parahaemolyticus]
MLNSKLIILITFIIFISGKEERSDKRRTVRFEHRSVSEEAPQDKLLINFEEREIISTGLFPCFLI